MMLAKRSHHLPKIFVWAICGFAQILQAETIPVRHLVGVHDTPSGKMTAGICPFLYSTPLGALCAINQYVDNDDAKIDMNVIGKFDEQAYADFSQLQKQPTESLVQRIFSDRKFNSASGIATIESYFNRSSISFTPLRLVQAYFVTNPVFPEVHYVSAQDSLFKAQHTFHLEFDRLADDFRKGHLLLSVAPWVVQRNRKYLDADLSDVITRQKKETKSSSIHHDVNVTIRYIPGTPWFRGVTLSAYNLNGAAECRNCPPHLLDIDLDSRPRTQVSADFGASLPVGALIVGAGVESQIEDDAKSPIRFNLTAVYKLTSFGFYGAFNEIASSIGFLYEGDFYKSGIIYTNEKQVNKLGFERTHEAFLVLGVSL